MFNLKLFRLPLLSICNAKYLELYGRIMCRHFFKFASFYNYKSYNNKVDIDNIYNLIEKVSKIILYIYKYILFTCLIALYNII